MSSFVSASTVGAGASGFCLRRMGIETAVLPTTLMGRHPGWGAPGGGAVPADKLQAMWDAIAQQPLTFDAVMTGYMGETAHISLAVDIIKHVKVKNPDAKILIDPVMGDAGRLYINPEAAEAIKTELIPRADILTPNLWELSFLTGVDYEKLLQSPLEAAKAAHALRNTQTEVLVTSVPFPPEMQMNASAQIGSVLVRGNHDPRFISHKKFTRVPHGGGDTLAAAYLARRLKNEPAEVSLAKSMGSILQIMSAAAAHQAAAETAMSEMPLTACQEALVNPTPLEAHKFPLTNAH